MTARRTLNIGLGLRARDPSILQPYARDAEASGFDHVWVYDSPRFAEPYVAMSYCAMATKNVTVGTAVTNTQTREPAVIANGFATLSTLTGGRVAMGVGLGDSAVKFIGRKPATFDDFTDKIRIIRAMLAGKEVEYNGKPLKLPVPPQKKVPVLVAAEGPKTFDFAGADCDGAIISPGGSPHFLRYAIEKIRAGAKRAQAVEELLPQVSRTLFKGAIRVPHEVLGFDKPLLTEEQRQYAMNAVGRQDMEYKLADELFSTMGDKLLQELTVVGTPDEVEAKLAEIAAVDGVSQLIVNVHAKDPKLTFETFRDRIVPKYRA